VSKGQHGLPLIEAFPVPKKPLGLLRGKAIAPFKTIVFSLAQLKGLACTPV
jgi:hypothetical protein